MATTPIIVAGQTRITRTPLAAPPRNVTPPAGATAPATPLLTPGAQVGGGSGSGFFVGMIPAGVLAGGTQGGAVPLPAGAFTPNIIAGACPGQVAPWSVLVTQTGAAPSINTVLPPALTSFLRQNPAIVQMSRLISGLLARLGTWSSAGATTCADIATVAWSTLGTLQQAQITSGILRPDVAVYLWRLRASWRKAATLFAIGANAQTGNAAPILSTRAFAALSAALAVIPPALPPLPTLGLVAGGVSY